MKVLKDNLQFIVLLVAMGVSWGTLMTRVEYIVDQQKYMTLEHESLHKELNEFSLTQTKHELRITLLEKMAAPLLSGN